MAPSRFIVIEGLIGVGKTSLCRLLQSQWNARLVLEPVEHNPFLAQFYDDRPRYAFPTQMFYLATRFSQQQELRQNELFHPLVVSDYLFEKDRLFAEETLTGDELALYDRFANLLGESATHPDFILFLESEISTILSRIRKRSIASEQVIEAGYLESLRERYYALWDRYNHAPIYVLDTTYIDYTQSLTDQRFILNLIQGWLDHAPLPNAPPRYQRRGPEQLQLI
ncbi:MAG: deoxynucleoside kinase [Myxococcales bacterium]|nr:deoxynucleoside kinase [Myxococcales bacterium]